MTRYGIFNELFMRLNFFRKGFRIHMLKKPTTEEEIIFEIDNYQCTRAEKYSFFHEDKELRLNRNGIIYKVEVIEAQRCLFYPRPKLGSVIGTWVIDVTEIK